MREKWMVYDTASGDMIFHDSEEKAEKDYYEASKELENGELKGASTVYMFRVEKAQTVINYPEED